MRTPITTRSCTKTNTDSKQALVLFMCIAVEAEMAKIKTKKSVDCGVSTEGMGGE